MLDLASTKEKILKFIVETMEESGAKGAVIGLSGGIDSSLCAALLTEAIGRDRVLGLLLPCESSKSDIDDGLLIARHLGIRYKTIDLTGTYKSFLADNSQKPEDNLTFANTKPRLRMTTLYFHAAKEGFLVAGTSNKSELVTGYLTKYGDGGVDFEPLADLLKMEVFELARMMKIPQRLIDKIPTAGLLLNQTDEAEMGFTYNDLDRFIETGIAEPEIASKILRMYTKSRHKIIGPKMLKLDRKFHLK